MIIGLDLGNTTGYSVMTDDGGLVYSGTWKCKKRTPAAVLAFYENLSSLVTEWDVSSIAYEAVKQNHKGKAAACAYGSWEGLVWLVSAMMDVGLVPVNPMDIKRWIGTFNADKADSEAAVYQKYGIVTADDNESDAIIISAIALGHETRHQK